MFRLTHVCRNEASLFHELMRVERPSLSKIAEAVEAGLAWENANKSCEMAVPKMTYKLDVDDDNKEEQILSLPVGGCKNCGLVHDRNKCSAIDRKCFDCGKIGHLGRVCRACSLSERRDCPRSRETSGCTTNTPQRGWHHQGWSRFSAR